ncbi:MAG TPA: protein-tyrosine phosphatase family protein [Xanthobacteraceae bacterium]|nr:protein-tyrosine phosphatase family protein [Xanthobacteraceae bacterium]
MIHVCSLSRLHDTVDETGARHVITLMREVDLVVRPTAIAHANHLILQMDDVGDPIDGYTPPADDHVTDLIRFVRAWDRAAPLVIHCYAGISRSTAGAFVAVCALNPDRDEAMVALDLRRASPSATPNIRIVTIADRMLDRRGRMVEAVTAIGRGASTYEAVPFRLDLT